MFEEGPVFLATQNKCDVISQKKYESKIIL